MRVQPDDRLLAGSDTVLGVESTAFPDVLSDAEGLTVGDLFTDEFVRAYSDFETFGTFLAESPVDVHTVSDFEDWRAMVRAAGEEYVQRRTTY